MLSQVNVPSKKGLVSTIHQVLIAAINIKIEICTSQIAIMNFPLNLHTTKITLKKIPTDLPPQKIFQRGSMRHVRYTGMI